MTDPSDLTTAPFVERHIGLREPDVEVMLKQLGFESLDALMEAAVPGGIRAGADLDLPPALTEDVAARELRRIAGLNRPAEAMIGLGYHATITPPVIRRNVLEDPSWYTAYTPYQPEISQGRLEALINFQTVIGDLTGLPTANASLLDEGTAAAEAMTLVRRGNRKAAGPFVVDADALPQTIDVVRTRAEAMGIDVVVADLADGLPEGELSGVLVQYPGASGRVLDPRRSSRPPTSATRWPWWPPTCSRSPCSRRPASSAPTSSSARRSASACRSSTAARTPATWRSPRVSSGTCPAGSSASRSTPRAARPTGSRCRPASSTSAATRRRPTSAPPRCCSPSSRRCTPSTTAPTGLREIAQRTHRFAARIAAALRAGGVELEHDTFFDTVTAVVPGRAADVVAGARSLGLQLRLVDADRVGISTSECTTPATVSGVLRAFGVAAPEVDEDVAEGLPADLRRATPYLTHEVFGSHHSETQMLRYLRRLSGRDYALDRGMIPLGSCTMKLNATTEMEPISLPGFADLHPFAPAEDAAGYRQLVDELEGWLAEVTGYDRVSIQPNAGSQGELAGLLAIRGYHRGRGDEGRNVCLIPSSAHGTNAASAVMAGMKVVVVKGADDGTVDLDDLRAACEKHADALAAIMVTYPSTHGAYEDTITELCEIVHGHGGQVYVDGANLNALLGHAKPGEFGGDVSHLNLHKTFCIPHGGGGPGVGPVAVREHLAPYLPSHPMHPEEAKRSGIGAISAAPYGSAGILPISWAYIRLMGGPGLARATAAAVLSANYVAHRLEEHYPVLYRGHGGLVAHECILDVRGLTKESGVSVDDVAKRLVDYGFHAPTMSFPVAGTLMVEPTESEDLAEIDRFCDAMIAIREEIAQVQAGTWSPEDSPLRHAPHTARALVGEWDRAYSREVGVFPTGVDPDKYWPPVARIDQAYGDRNLVCACPPPEAFAE